MNPDNFKEAWQDPSVAHPPDDRCRPAPQRGQAQPAAFHRHDILARCSRNRRRPAAGTVVVLPGSQAVFALDMVSDGAGRVVGCRASCWSDRFATTAATAEPGEPLRQHVESSLSELEHQIWLLQNVFWWTCSPSSWRSWLSSPKSPGKTGRAAGGQPSPFPWQSPSAFSSSPPFTG